MDNMKEKRKSTTCEIGMTSTRVNRKANKKRKILSLTSNNVLSGIIFSEILGKPKSLKNK